MSAVLKQKGVDSELVFYDNILSPDYLPDQTDFETISVFVDSLVNAEVIDKFPQLKFIATRSTGYDHIDLEKCAQRGVKVANVPTYGENTVAEHAFGLLLALSKRIYDGYHQLREGGEYDPSKLQGFDLKGKMLGVVGTGHIGQHAIRIGNGFQMKVIGYDAFPKPELEEQLGFKYVKDFTEILAQSDVLTLHVPYLESTHHMINKDNIMKMKKGAVLINTSRGPVVETEALLQALASGHLYGAGLDVVEEEGVIKDEMHFLVAGNEAGHNLKVALANHLLINMPNVIMTPHSAFNTKEALQRILDTTAENIAAFISGNPINLVVAKK